LATFRLKLLENQRKLEEAFKELEDETPRPKLETSLEIPFVLSQSESEEVTVKVEQMSDDEDRFSLKNEDVKMEDSDDFGFMREF
jgi:hypothetical protein